MVTRRRLKKVITFQRAMTKKGCQFFSRKDRVTLSVAAPGNSNSSDATDKDDDDDDDDVLFNVHLTAGLRPVLS